jgi:hypothetical protein
MLNVKVTVSQHFPTQSFPYSWYFLWPLMALSEKNKEITPENMEFYLDSVKFLKKLRSNLRIKHHKVKFPAI